MSTCRKFWWNGSKCCVNLHYVHTYVRIQIVKLTISRKNACFHRLCCTSQCSKQFIQSTTRFIGYIHRLWSPRRIVNFAVYVIFCSISYPQKLSHTNVFNGIIRLYHYYCRLFAVLFTHRTLRALLLSLFTSWLSAGCRKRVAQKL